MLPRNTRFRRVMIPIAQIASWGKNPNIRIPSNFVMVPMTRQLLRYGRVTFALLRQTFPLLSQVKYLPDDKTSIRFMVRRILPTGDVPSSPIYIPSRQYLIPKSSFSVTSRIALYFLILWAVVGDHVCRLIRGKACKLQRNKAGGDRKIPAIAAEVMTQEIFASMVC